MATALACSTRKSLKYGILHLYVLCFNQLIIKISPIDMKLTSYDWPNKSRTCETHSDLCLREFIWFSKSSEILLCIPINLMYIFSAHFVYLYIQYGNYTSPIFHPNRPYLHIPPLEPYLYLYIIRGVHPLAFQLIARREPEEMFL